MRKFANPTRFLKLSRALPPWLSVAATLPKRWISVTAPVWAALRENPAFLIRCVAMTR